MGVAVGAGVGVGGTAVAVAVGPGVGVAGIAVGVAFGAGVGVAGTRVAVGFGVGVGLAHESTPVETTTITRSNASMALTSFRIDITPLLEVLTARAVFLAEIITQHLLRVNTIHRFVESVDDTRRRVLYCHPHTGARCPPSDWSTQKGASDVCPNTIRGMATPMDWIYWRENHCERLPSTSILLKTKEAAIMEEKVTFYSDGIPLVGSMWIPDDYRKGERLPGVISVHGITVDYRIGGAKTGHQAVQAQYLNRAGYVVLSFNFRGFGESGGERKAVTMMEEVADLRNSITYLQQRPEIDPEKIALAGWSLGGAVVSYTAGIDDRAKATVSHWGVGNGYRWLKSLWRLPEWRALLKELDEDRKQRVLTGKSKRVPLEHIWIVGPNEAAGEAEREKNDMKGGMIPLTFFESIINFKPEDVVDRISPRAIFWQHTAVELGVDCEESVIMYEKAKEPKKLWIIPESDVRMHFDVYSPAYFSKVMQVTIDWLKQYVPPNR